MAYELRLFDEVILKFKVEKTQLERNYYIIIDFDKKKTNLLPVGMKPTDNDLQKFLESRVIPKNREFVDEILATQGLTIDNTIGIINICKGLSLNDSYWITEEGFEGSFEQYNLFDNNFTRVLALVAYTGYGTSTKKGFTSSPEYTTNGMLKKCWRRIDGNIYLYKGGSSGFANSGNEPYSEFYAAQIAEKMGIQHIDYNLAKWKGVLCSTCKLFTNKETTFVPIYKFVDNYNIDSINDFLKSLGNEFYEPFCDMLIFDALVHNTDRHFGNFGLLVESRTNKILQFAPLFDHGISLFSEAMESDFKNIDEYFKKKNPPYNMTWDSIVKYFLGPSQKSRLRKLIGFRFKRHSRYNLDKKRLKAIEDFIQRRVDYLLNY